MTYVLKLYHLWGSVFLKLDRWSRQVCKPPKAERAKCSSAHPVQTTSSSAQDPFKGYKSGLMWIYSESSELFWLKGDWIAQGGVSSQAKAGEFAVAELNSSESPYFLLHPPRQDTGVLGVEIRRDFLSKLKNCVALKIYSIFTNACSGRVIFEQRYNHQGYIFLQIKP